MSAHTFSFYSPSLEASDATTVLEGDEHHHLSRVLRMEHGQRVRLTNGRGLVVAGEIESMTTSKTIVRVHDVVAIRPMPAPLVLALGLLPRVNMETALGQCIEAGITGWIPLLAAKRHVRRHSGASGGRWQRIAVAAMKQSGRGWLPRVDEPVTAHELATTFESFEDVWLADGEAGATLETAGPDRAVLGIVGPEAGFSEDEMRTFVDAGAKQVALSAQRLRAETAALAMVSMLALHRTAV